MAICRSLMIGLMNSSGLVMIWNTGWSRNIKYEGFSKPSARLVSTRVMSSKEITSDEVFTHMLMQWGQFLDHDIVLAVPGMAGESFGEHVNCRTYVPVLWSNIQM